MRNLRWLSTIDPQAQIRPKTVTDEKTVKTWSGISRLSSAPAAIVTDTAVTAFDGTFLSLTVPRNFGAFPCCERL